MNSVKNEKGEIMLEGIIVTCVTLFMLVWILGIGFIYYQRSTLTIIANDAAVKIADTYCYPSSDLIIGYIEPEDFTNRDLYRGKLSDSLFEKNSEKVQKYVEYRLQKTNFYGVIDSVEVNLEIVSDSALRKHVEVSARCIFKTPFGGALNFMGMSDTFDYRAVGRADCTDMIEYISTVDFGRRIATGADIKSNWKNLINSSAKLIYKLIDLFNHSYD